MDCQRERWLPRVGYVLVDFFKDGTRAINSSEAERIEDRRINSPNKSIDIDKFLKNITSRR